jgi:hypothetical protein
MKAAYSEWKTLLPKHPKANTSFLKRYIGTGKKPRTPQPAILHLQKHYLRNLYGVDIMKEAVEIAKLRLFLKLVATVEADYRKPNLGLEPLPDIDFNIRAGNTLVGFATEAELQKGLTYTLDFVIAKPLIEEKCEIVANAFKRYKEIQLTYGDDFKEFKKAKSELNKRLKELNHELNQLLHKQASGLKYETWLQSHQPFHWFAEFYEIVQGNGGFDVIIGNPPYVEYSYWYYVATSDAHNFTKHIIYNFPIDEFPLDKIQKVFTKYQKDLDANSVLKTANYKSTGTITYREYYVRKSKLIIDEIDKALAEQYQFIDEELDFIANYDIKYRMGKELEEEE